MNGLILYLLFIYAWSQRSYCYNIQFNFWQTFFCQCHHWILDQPSTRTFWKKQIVLIRSLNQILFSNWDMQQTQGGIISTSVSNLCCFPSPLLSPTFPPISLWGSGDYQGAAVNAEQGTLAGKENCQNWHSALFRTGSFFRILSSESLLFVWEISVFLEVRIVSLCYNSSW